MSFDDFLALVISRRTQLVMDQTRDVDSELVTKLCEAASWAPNHQQTWPWRFGVFTGESRRGLGEVAAEAMRRRGDAENKEIGRAHV